MQNTRGMVKWERKRIVAHTITERLGRLPWKIVPHWTLRNTSRFLLICQTVDKCSCQSKGPPPCQPTDSGSDRHLEPKGRGRCGSVPRGPRGIVGKTMTCAIMSSVRTTVIMCYEGKYVLPRLPQEMSVHDCPCGILFPSVAEHL